MTSTAPMGNRSTKKERKVKAWAVVRGNYIINEGVAYGHGAAICLTTMKGIYKTKAEGEDMRIRWANCDSFVTVPCTITYSL